MAIIQHKKREGDLKLRIAYFLKQLKSKGVSHGQVVITLAWQPGGLWLKPQLRRKNFHPKYSSLGENL